MSKSKYAESPTKTLASLTYILELYCKNLLLRTLGHIIAIVTISSIVLYEIVNL